MRPLRLLLLGAALLLSACPKRVPSPTSVLDEAAAAAESGNADARTFALAGFHAWLVGGDVERATRRFDQARTADANEPWTQYGRLLLARRAGHPEVALDAAFQLTERAPSHPLAVSAARFVLELVGTSTAMDEVILRRSEAALAASPRGDTAQLLRSAMATVHGQRLQAAEQSKVLGEMSVVDAWTLVGPLSPFHVLAFDQRLPAEDSGSLDGPFEGPFGKVAPRTLRFPDGRFSLAGEPPEGDVYLLAADFELAAPGTFVVRTVTHASHDVLLDGTLLSRSRGWERAESTVSARGVELEAGRHRLLLKLSNEDGAAHVSVSLLRADGAPANVRFEPARGAAPAWAGVKVLDEVPLVFPTPEAFATALEEEVGAVLASFVAARDGLGRDPDGAQRMMARIEAATPLTPALLALRAELALGDRNIPPRVARGRATRDLEATLEKDKQNVHALLLRAQLALDDGRQLEAAELVKRARAADATVGYPVPLLRSRVDLVMGMDPQAETSADEALALQPGLCEALGLRYDLARRRDAVALADELVARLEGCPGSRTRQAEHARVRGQTGKAIQLYQELLERDPSNVGTVQTLAGLYTSAERYEDAVKLLERTRTLWPRNAELLRRLGDVHDFAGHPQQALAAREEALRFAGGDLGLRRSVHRAKTGKELLSEYAVDGKEALRRYEEQPGSEDAQSVLVLDAAAVEAFADGSMVDRIHVIQKALSQEGVDAIAEVNLPAGAAVLSMRTIKRDGTVLEPEAIEGKDSISMPAVQVGDYVQYEYLQAHAPRGPAQPGFSAGSFYFQVAGVPNRWSTYVVVAPKELGMSVDAHNVKSPQPSIEGGRSVYRHEELNVPPYLPEPNAPPSPNEYLPWVQLGAGARGNDGLVAVYADAFLDRAKLTHEVEAFARKAAEGTPEGVERIRAVHAAVMRQLQGRDAGLTSSAASSLAQGRGSRLWVLKASLESLGIPTRLALIRTFHADPAQYLFPNETLLPYLALRAELPDGTQVWLDTVVRFGPFGQLPESARDCEAFLLPEPGRPLEKVKTPAGEPSAGKLVTLALKLGADGSLRGSGEERYTGFDAAQLTEWLEQLPPDQRKQALQSALARYYGGAEMEKLDLELVRDVGGELTVRYQFRVPAFARVENGKLILGALTYPAQLGRRYVQVGSRTTPLFVESPERTTTRVTLELPAGHALNGPIGELQFKEDFGSFTRREAQQGDVVTIEEEFRLAMMRLPPSRYEDFAHFAGQVDLLQTRDLLVEKR